MTEPTKPMDYHGIPRDVIEFLRKPFEDHEVEFLPKQIVEDRSHPGQYSALAFPYINREAATMRLHDSGLCWEFKHEVEEKSAALVVVKGILLIHLRNGVSLRFEDYGEARSRGGEDEERDAKEIFKEAVTDAFKRVVRFVGIGSYLVSKKMGNQWRSCEVYFPKNGNKPKFKKWVEDGSRGSSGGSSGQSSGGSTATYQSKLASANQVSRIQRDAAARGVSEKAILEKYKVTELASLSSRQASECIDELKTKPVVA